MEGLTHVFHTTHGELVLKEIDEYVIPDWQICLTESRVRIVYQYKLITPDGISLPQDDEGRSLPPGCLNQATAEQWAHDLSPAGRAKIEQMRVELVTAQLSNLNLD